jgi:hypothetical protein
VECFTKNGFVGKYKAVYNSVTPTHKRVKFILILRFRPPIFLFFVFWTTCLLQQGDRVASEVVAQILPPLLLNASQRLAGIILLDPNVQIASATRADRPMYDLQGPWDVEVTSWPDIHWDLNIQLTYQPMLASDHLDLLEHGSCLTS